jgi:hypothetical protein
MNASFSVSFGQNLKSSDYADDGMAGVLGKASFFRYRNGRARQDLQRPLSLKIETT